MNTLKLETWELPHNSRDPLSGKIHWQMMLQWQGRLRNVGARVVTVKGRFAIVFVCDLDEPQLGNWVVCSSYGDAVYLHRCPHHWFEYLNTYLPAIAQNERGTFGRLFVWGARRSAVITESGEGSWLRFKGDTFIPSTFQISAFDSELWFNSSSTTRDVIQRHWEQDAAIRFGYKWSQLSYMQKMTHWFGQDLEEVRYLLKLVLVVQLSST